MKIEIGQYRRKDKGALRAFFSLVMHPHGLKILDCRYFVQGDKRWFSFPQKEIKYTDGRKTEYIPYISIIDKEYLELLKIEILKELKKHDESEQNQSQAAPVQNQAPDDSFIPPF